MVELLDAVALLLAEQRAARSGPDAPAAPGGPAAARRVAELARDATGAVAATFLVHGPLGRARVVGAGGELRGALGRLIELHAPPRLGTRAGVVPLSVADFSPSLAAELAPAGVDRVLHVPVRLAGGAEGSLQVYLPDLPGPPPGAEALPFLAELAATLYGADSVAVEPAPDEPAQESPRELFVAMTGHELRTPVTVIRGYTDTLVEHWDVLDEDARRGAVLVLGQRARDLSRLVDRVLTVAADVAGLTDTRPRVPFDLVDTLTDAVAQLPPELGSWVRPLVAPPVLPKAVGDRAGVSTILAELVTNACKHSSTGVDIELIAGADDQTVWFQVSDRGVGVRPEHVERAFERFWQFDSGDQRRHGGVGLGLYLVRRIVERQDGWVYLRPRDGGGTVVEVRLPRADPILRGA